MAYRNFNVNVQTFTSSGSYTPTPGMLYCVIEVLGGGGGSGGCDTSGPADISVSSGGGGGEYARGVFSASTIGVSQAVTIGSAGAAGTAGVSTGGTGGTTSVGVLITAIGGSGGTGTATSSGQVNSLGAIGGTGGSGGDFRIAGNDGGNATGLLGAVQYSGSGGTSYFGGGALGFTVPSPGNAGKNYGSGASGGINYNGPQFAGAAGSKGLVVITQYIIN